MKWINNAMQNLTLICGASQINCSLFELSNENY